MKSSVIPTVVEKNLCIGCGICTTLCPREVLTMQWNRCGEYNPVEVKPCTTECGLCLQVCPFADNEQNEDVIGDRLYGTVEDIQHRSETGYYLATYVGHSEKHRPTSASGGIVTWLLETLLIDGIVDHVVCVAPTGDPERLSAFKICNTIEDLRTSAGSAYYPVEMSHVIKHILETPGRYAITGLPCFIKALRLAQQSNIKLRERIVITVGLTCGQLKSSQFTDYIATLAGVRGEVTRVCYRGKSPDHMANNYHYSFTTREGEARKIFWSEGIAKVWTNRWFTLNACNHCDDVFAECADITCMDAWLPEYLHDSQGTSLVLVRSPLVKDLIEKGQGVSLDVIPIEKVVQSQAAVTSLKTQNLAYRLYLNKHNGNRILKKRVKPEKIGNILWRKKVIIYDRMQGLSREADVSCYESISKFQAEIKPYLIRIRILGLISEGIKAPRKGIYYLNRKIRSWYNEK